MQCTRTSGPLVIAATEGSPVRREKLGTTTADAWRRHALAYLVAGQHVRQDDTLLLNASFKQVVPKLTPVVSPDFRKQKYS